ncbi:MAG: enoyl-CoA hydratase family protein [Candidatus Eiseniibacteriota bacterium]
MGLAPRSFLYQFDAASGVALITLNRPERLNALTFEVYAELRDTFRALDSESGVRAVVLTGAGRAFCSGGDVEDIIGALFDRDAQGRREFTRMTCDLILAIRRCRRPVIAALNGTVAGAGAVIACACDLRIAAPSARIAFLFVRVGLSGADMGAAWLLPRLIGLSSATELLMTGDFITAERAYEIGLYQRLASPERLMDEALALAAALARGPSPALAVTKRALDDEHALTLEEALRREADLQAGLMEHPNFREAYQAFRSKREARFE